jgi:anhydro-N-acetylmuramic acid kinase
MQDNYKLNSKIFTAIGLMSGTSMDGVDVALIKTDGHKILEFGNNFTIPYQKDFKQELRELVFKRGQVEKPLLKNISENLTLKHLEAVETLLMKEGVSRTNVDVIGFHGHTVDHRPFDKFTWQIGDGRLLAEITRINVVNDFRKADIKNGGQGAPLMPIYHKAIIDENIYPACVLNIGGVANITYIDGENTIAFDTGTGNALIDDYLFEKTGLSYDDEGKFAMSGKIIEDLANILKADNYFSIKPPKSLDRNHFISLFANFLTGQKEKNSHEFKTEDIITTLSDFTVFGVVNSLKFFPKVPNVIYVCGGGVHNKYFMQEIEKQSGIKTHSISKAKYGLNPDAIEAQGFAFMAVRNILKLPITFASTTGVKKNNIICGAFYRA